MSSHLKKINKSYFQHMAHALKYSWILFKISLVLFIHSLFPNIFVHYASTRIQSIKEEMENDNRNSNN